MSKTVTPEFRVAFPAVFQPKRNDLNGKDEFSIVALFPKGADLSGLKKAANDAAVKKFGADTSKWPPGMRSPFRDQGERIEAAKRENKPAPQGYEAGAIYLTLRSTQRPGVVDQNVQEIIDQADFYGGCWAKASLNAYAYDQKGNRGVAFGLGNLQKVRDDDYFGNRTKPQDDFAAVEGADAGSNASTDANSLFS